MSHVSPQNACDMAGVNPSPSVRLGSAPPCNKALILLPFQAKRKGVDPRLLGLFLPSFNVPPIHVLAPGCRKDHGGKYQRRCACVPPVFLVMICRGMERDVCGEKKMVLVKESRNQSEFSFS